MGKAALLPEYAAVAQHANLEARGYPVEALTEARGTNLVRL